MMTNTVRKFGVGVATAALVAGAAMPAFAADLTANRLAGPDRYETAYEVANHEFPNGSTVAYVARGDNLVDAITAGQLNDGPLFLLNDNADLQAKIKSYLSKKSVGRVVVIGGTKAISDDVVKTILPTGMNYDRISGEDRYETAVKIAQRAAGITSTKTSSTVPVYLANGTSMVDALVGGQLIKGTNGVLLLTDGTDALPKATAQAINKNFYQSTITALGGTKAISDAALTAANVAKVILADSYLEQFQAEIKAAAEARVKVEGYYSISPSVNQKDVLDLITDPVDKAEAAAIYPKVPTGFAATYFSGKKFFVPTSADDGTVLTDHVQPSLVADAVQWESEKLDNDQPAVNYKGTAAALTDAQAAAAADLANYNAANVQKVVDRLTNNFIKTGDSTATPSTGGATYPISAANTADSGNAATSAQLSVLPGNITDASTVADVLEAFGIDVPAHNADSSGNAVNTGAVGWTTATVTDLNNELSANVIKNAIIAKHNKIVSDLPTATSAAVAANKTLTAANKVLQDRLNGRLPGYTLNRISGADRYATSVAIAKEVYGETGSYASQYIYFANGEAFADAAVSGLLDSSSPDKHGPVLLVQKDAVPASVMTYAKALDKYADYSSSKIYAIGGTAVISDANLQNIIDTLGKSDSGIKVSYTGGVVTYTDTTEKVAHNSNNGATVDFTPRVANPTGNIVTTLEYRDDSGEWQTIATGGGTTVATGVSLAASVADVTPESVGTITATVNNAYTAGTTQTKDIPVRAHTVITDGRTNSVLLDTTSAVVYIRVALS